MSRVIDGVECGVYIRARKGKLTLHETGEENDVILKNNTLSSNS